MTNDDLILEASTRRAFLTAMAVFGASMALGCASKKDGKTKSPESANSQLGSALRDVDKRLKAAIPDKTRRKAASEIADRGKFMILELTTVLEDWRDEIRLLDAADKKDRAITNEITAKYNRQLRKVLEDTCKLGIELREHVKREEWPVLFPPLGGGASGPEARLLLGGVPC